MKKSWNSIWSNHQWTLKWAEFCFFRNPVHLKIFKKLNLTFDRRLKQPEDTFKICKNPQNRPKYYFFEVVRDWSRTKKSTPSKITSLYIPNFNSTAQFERAGHWLWSRLFSRTKMRKDIRLHLQLFYTTELGVCYTNFWSCTGYDFPLLHLVFKFCIRLDFDP